MKMLEWILGTIIGCILIKFSIIKELKDDE
jgi:hypothetical protein